MIEITDATLRDASFVIANLRPLDELELMCQLPDDVKRHEVAYALLHSGDCFVAKLDGQPVAIFGSSLVNQACLSLWALGTKRMRRVAPAITRFMFAKHIPDRADQGFRIAEARSIETHREAHRWMTATGAVRVDPPFEYGKNGEMFVLYRWTKAAFEAMKMQRETSQ